MAKYLESHPAVEKVVHPLLASHPSHALAMSQNGGRHSGMITFYVKGGEKEASDTIAAFRVIRHNPIIQTLVGFLGH